MNADLFNNYATAFEPYASNRLPGLVKEIFNLLCRWSSFSTLILILTWKADNRWSLDFLSRKHTLDKVLWYRLQ
jgi:hypothetical protein